MEKMKIKEIIWSNKKEQKGFKATHGLLDGINELKEYYLSGKNIFKNV